MCKRKARSIKCQCCHLPSVLFVQTVSRLWRCDRQPTGVRFEISPHCISPKWLSFVFRSSSIRIFSTWLWVDQSSEKVVASVKNLKRKFIFKHGTLEESMNASRSIHLFKSPLFHQWLILSTLFVNTHYPCIHKDERAHVWTVEFVICLWWKFDPYEVVWCRVLVFHLPTDAAPGADYPEPPYVPYPWAKPFQGRIIFRIGFCFLMTPTNYPERFLSLLSKPCKLAWRSCTLIGWLVITH